MGDGIYCALSGALAQQTALETVATNLSNASTQGYRGEKAVFREVLSRAGAEGPLRFAAVQATALDGQQGSVRSTGRDLDVAFPDGVFLAVQTPAGERYTRAGSLHVTADGTLATASGHPVLSETNQPLTVAPGGTPSISSEGALVVGGEVQSRLKLVSFTEAQWLSHEGSTLLASNDRSGPPTPASGVLATGSLEDSNASAVTAMTDMMSASRMFEAFQRAIETFHDADRRVATTTAGT